MARNVVDELVVRLTADASRLQAELGKAERGATESGKKVGASFGTAFRNAARLGAIATASLTAVGTAFFVAANKAAAYADQIDKTAIRTRISRGALQELAFAADQAGVQFTAIEANIRAFTGRLAEAERGSATVISTFDRLGVSLRDQNGALRDTESLFLDTIEALSGIDNESTRAALAVQAFGEQGSALLPFLSLGADGLDDLRAKARELGLVLDDQAIKSLVDYKDEVSALGQQFAAVQREAVTKLIPVLRDDVIPLVRDDLLPAFVSLVNFLVDDVAPIVGTIATNFTDLNTAFNTFVQSWEAGEGRLEGTLGVLERIQKALGFNVSALTQEGLDLVYGSVSPSGSGGRDAGVPRGVFTGPDFGNLPAAFGPQPRPAGFVASPAAGGAGAFAGGGAAGAVARTVADVFADLAADGAARERFAAAFGLTPENIIASATARQGLVESALRELLSDFAGVVTDAQIAFLVERYTALGEVIRQNSNAAIPLPDVSAIAGGARGIPIPGVTSTQPDAQDIRNARIAQNDLTLQATLAAAALETFTDGLEGLRRTRNIPIPGVSVDVAGTVPIPLPDVTATGASREQLQALASEANAVALEAIKAEAGLRSFTQELENLSRIRTIPIPGVTATASGPGVPVGIPLPDVQGIEDATNAQINAVRAQEAAALQTKQAIVTAGVQFASDLAGAIKSGSPSGIFGALTGGIGSLVGTVNPFAGGLISLIGGLFGGLLPDGRDSSEAARAAGATPGGAPAIELNLSVFQNLAVQSLTGESRAAVDGLLDQTVGRIESVLVSFGQRLTAVEARTA